MLRIINATLYGRPGRFKDKDEADEAARENRYHPPGTYEHDELLEENERRDQEEQQASQESAKQQAKKSK